MKSNRFSGVPSEIVFLLEEKSARSLLNSLLPRILPGIRCICIPHQGMGELQQKIPEKLREWRTPGARFVVLHDQDDGDCKLLKSKLLGLCAKGGRSDAIVCITCRELEAWYWGDLEAVAKIYPRFKPQNIKNREKLRHTDAIMEPAEALEKRIPGFHKGNTAKRIGPHMNLDNNNSPSFQHFIKKVRIVAGLNP